VVYGEPKEEDAKYQRTWRLVRFLVGKLMIRRFVPFMEKALKEIPSTNISLAHPGPLKEWVWTMTTVGVFVGGYGEHSKHSKKGFCDNIKVCKSFASFIIS
jgi:hypothetical protein